MGCGPSRPTDPEARLAKDQNDQIEKQLRLDRKADQKTVKILLLGAGESGKSTIIKQMRIIHSTGFEDDEKYQTRAVIYSNIIVACKALLETMQYKKVAFTNSITAAQAQVILSANPDLDADDAFQDETVQTALRALWADQGVHDAMSLGCEVALNDNIHYYFENLDRMFDSDWMPTDQDMLHARMRTTGITETFFDLGNICFRMMDVGGQRSERKKWIHCFEGVQCLLFLASLSGYDQALLEDIRANQMHESLILFDSLVNGEWFKDKPIILFLNKMDLFKAKLEKSPISTYFPDYQGAPGDEKAARKFFAKKFQDINRNANREIHVHFTNATDTNLLKATMQSVQNILIRKQLEKLM